MLVPDLFFLILEYHARRSCISFVIPAQARIALWDSASLPEIPACAGMTGGGKVRPKSNSLGLLESYKTHFRRIGGKGRFLGVNFVNFDPSPQPIHEA